MTEDAFGWCDNFKCAGADLHFHFVLNAEELPVVLDRKILPVENDLLCFKMFLRFLEGTEIDARKVQPVLPAADLEEGDIDKTVVDLGLRCELPLLAGMAGFSENTVKNL